MSEETSAAVVQENPSGAGAPPTPSKPKSKRRKKGRSVRNAIIAVVVVAALAVGGYFLWQFLNKAETVNSEIQTATADWSSIQSSVQGSGSARAKESAAITLQNAGIVQKVYVAEGQMVMEGDPLYEIVSPAAQEAYDAAVKRVGELEKEVQVQADQLAKAQQTLADLQAGKGSSYRQLAQYRENLEKLQKDRAELEAQQVRADQDRFVKAPFAGQLQETQRYIKGTFVDSGIVVAKLVDDSRFRIPFYFSYGYEGQIAVGQAATVSVRGSDLAGTVEEVNMVRRVSPEGSLLFEAVVVVNNPGALTKGLSVNCSLAGADGTALYPYDAGTLDYYRTADIATKTAGDVASSALRDYTDVTAGQVILTLEKEDFTERFQSLDQQIADAKTTVSDQEAAIDQELKAQQEAIESQAEAVTNAQAAVTEAQEKVTEAQKALDDFAAVAPISGTITSCMLSEGQEVKSGDTVITISNNATMVVTIQVDDRNIAYVKPGMGVNLTSNWGDGGSFYGVVTKIDMSLSGDAMGSGMTNYPVTLEVDNFDGSLLEGMWLSYSFVTSQSDNCIVVPMQAVQYVSLADGETASAVFIQADSRPENALDVDIPEVMPGETPKFPAESDGYYAVPVTTGLSDNYNVEITEGLNGGETVFVAYYVEQAWG